MLEQNKTKIKYLLSGASRRIGISKVKDALRRWNHKNTRLPTKCAVMEWAPANFWSQRVCPYRGTWPFPVRHRSEHLASFSIPTWEFFYSWNSEPLKHMWQIEIMFAKPSAPSKSDQELQTYRNVCSDL